MEILNKTELIAFTGKKHLKSIKAWLSNNNDTLMNYGLFYAGGINAVGLPIVQKVKAKKVRTQKEDWKPEVLK